MPILTSNEFNFYQLNVYIQRSNMDKLFFTCNDWCIIGVSFNGFLDSLVQIQVKNIKLNYPAISLLKVYGGTWCILVPWGGTY